MTREELEAAYHTYAKPVYVYLLKCLGDEEEAQDVLHDTFVQLYSVAGSTTIINLSGYLFRIARNLSLDRNAKRQKRAPITNELIDRLFVEMSTDDLDDRLDALTAAMSMLDERSREVLVLAEYEGLSFSEISSITGEPEGALRTRCWRARIRLRELLVSYLEQRS